MTTVFIAGSRRISRLGKPVLERLENIVSSGHSVVVGDANGVDKAVQKYLADKGYQKVKVYILGSGCRNNLGGWSVRSVPLLNGKRGFESYAARDLAMAKDGDVGFFIWDGKSKGTANNISNMLKLAKISLVFVAPWKRMISVKTEEDFIQIIKLRDEANGGILASPRSQEASARQPSFSW